MIADRPVAVEEWGRLWRELHKRGLAGQVDERVALLWASTFADWVDYCKALEEHGPYVRAERGGMKANPAASMKKQAADTLGKLAAELGFTPTAAARAGVGSGADDEFMELLRQRERKE